MTWNAEIRRARSIMTPSTSAPARACVAQPGMRTPTPHPHTGLLRRKYIARAPDRTINWTAMRTYPHVVSAPQLAAAEVGVVKACATPSLDRCLGSAGSRARQHLFADDGTSSAPFERSSRWLAIGRQAAPTHAKTICQALDGAGGLVHPAACHRWRPYH